MLEPVALHQTGFKVPGIAQDARGVVVGSHAATLLTSIDRLVSHLRLLSEELQLDELLPSLRIDRVKNRLGAQAYILTVACADSQLLDRLARVARLVMAPLCVGTLPHFVAYRDRRAPLGYDVDEIATDPRDFTLYTAAFTQSYTRLGALPFERLLAQLELLPLPGGARAALATRLGGDTAPLPGATVARPGPGTGSPLDDELWLTVPPGLVRRTLRYLWERGVATAVALLDPDAPAAPEAPPATELRRDTEPAGALLKLQAPPPRVLALLAELTEGTPAPGAASREAGLRLYQPLGINFAVELGYAHPLRLRSCQSVLRPEDVFLFSGQRRGFQRIPSPHFVPAERLVQLHEPLAELLPAALGGARTEAPPEPGPPLRPRPAAMRPTAGSSRGEDGAPLVKVPLRLIAQPTPGAAPTATLIPWARARRLGQLLYLLPMPLVAGCRMALLDAGVLLTNPAGISGLPLGHLFYEAAAGVLVPLGMALTPRLPASLLAAHLTELAHSYVVCMPPERSAGLAGRDGRMVALSVRRDALAPITDALLAPLLTHSDSRPQNKPASDDVTPAVLLNDPIGLFPLWGYVGEPE